MSLPVTMTYIKENVSLIGISGISPGTSCFTEILSGIAEQSVIVDMINYSSMPGRDMNFSFSVSDNDLPNVLTSVGKFKISYPLLHTDVSSRNTKFCFYSDEMRVKEGVAAGLLKLFEDEQISIKLITTSETEISVLVDDIFAEQIIRLSVERLKSKIEVL